MIVMRMKITVMLVHPHKLLEVCYKLLLNTWQASEVVYFCQALNRVKMSDTTLHEKECNTCKSWLKLTFISGKNIDCQTTFRSTEIAPRPKRAVYSFAADSRWGVSRALSAE